MKNVFLQKTRKLTEKYSFFIIYFLSVFNPLKIPKKLEASLPYKSKPKVKRATKNKSYTNKRAVVMEPQERKMYTMMQQARTIRNDKVLKRKAKKMEKRAKKRKIMEREKNKFAEHHREAKKKMYIKAGKERMSRLNGGHKASSNKDRNNT